MDTTEKPDRDLLLAFIDGDEAAFNELYCRFRRDVRKVVFKYHRPNFEIEDICQHFWTGLLQYAHSYDRSRPVRNWLISVAVKSASSYARKQRPLSLVSLDSPDRHEQSPVAQAIVKEEATVVLKAMRKLPAAYQRIIHAVYLKGQSPGRLLCYIRREHQHGSRSDQARDEVLARASRGEKSRLEMPVP